MKLFSKIIAGALLSFAAIAANAAIVDITPQMPEVKIAGQAKTFNLTFSNTFDVNDGLSLQITYNLANNANKSANFSWANGSSPVSLSNPDFQDESVFIPLDLAAINAINTTGKLSLIIKVKTGNWTVGVANPISPIPHTDIQAPAVPVPAAAWLMGSGLAALLLARRRKMA